MITGAIRADSKGGTGGESPITRVRLAVRDCLRRHPPGGRPILVACSGGADSLALAVAAGQCRHASGTGLVTVDHGLQPGSAERAEQVTAWARAQGLEPAVAVAVDVAGLPGGPEAAARTARYRALAAVAERIGAAAVLLGQTREDQAETVLLALARGAGPRGLSGMPERRVRHGVVFLRPLLDVGRAQTRAVCAELGLTPWVDPHNTDPRFARARVRAALPVLADLLGPDVVANLARTAKLLACDTAALDGLAATERAKIERTDPGHADPGLAVDRLAELVDAIRTRVLHAWVRSLGVPGGALAHRHIVALDALVTSWRGQGPVWLPGGIAVGRRAGWLVRWPASASEPLPAEPLAPEPSPAAPVGTSSPVVSLGESQDTSPTWSALSKED